MQHELGQREVEPGELVVISDKGIESVNHTATFDIDEAALPLGVRTLVTLALGGLALAATLFLWRQARGVGVGVSLE